MAESIENIIIKKADINGNRVLQSVNSADIFYPDKDYNMPNSKGSSGKLLSGDRGSMNSHFFYKDLVTEKSRTRGKKSVDNKKTNFFSNTNICEVLDASDLGG